MKITHVKADPSLFIKQSSTKRQSSSSQEMGMDQPKPKLECKPAVILDNGDSMNDTAMAEPNTDIIKQEEPTKKTSLPAIDTSQLNYYYVCHTCNEIMSSLTTYLNHLASVHAIKHRNNTIKHPETEPDMHDPTFHCRACEKTYTSKDKYWYHLKFTHYMVLKSTAAAAAAAEKIAATSKRQLPVPQDPNFYCRVCDIKHVDKQTYNQHLGTVHNMYLKSRRDLNVMPEWDSPNNYCRACRYSYAGKYNYRLHCRRVHHMTAPAADNHCRLAPHLQDANNYCKVCDFTYKTHKLYLSHCSRIHNIKPPEDTTTTTTTTTTPDPNDPNYHCGTCDKTYLHASFYRKHLISVHKMAQAQQIKVPDMHDPNGYCCACEKTYSSIHYYKVHVATFHAIEPQQQQQPNVDDPNFHCRSCQKTFSDHNKYRAHLDGAHKMKQTSMRSPVAGQHNDPDVLPDPLDPALYCRVCKIKLKTIKLFRRHCRHRHHMTLDPIPLPNPDAEIDVNSPACYCVKCDMYMKRVSNFTRHLRVKHQIKVVRKRGRPQSHMFAG